MKVKELIEWLSKKNPEDFVGLWDYGQDSGDLYELNLNWFENKENNIENLQVVSLEEANKLKMIFVK